MKIKILFGLGGVVIGSLIVVALYPSNRTTQDVLACTTEFNFTRNEGKPNEVKVNAIAQFYIRQDGTGLTTYKGASKAKGTEMIVDRDVNFTWERRKNDHVIMLTYKNTLRRHNDNTPDSLWGVLRARVHATTLLSLNFPLLCGLFKTGFIQPTFVVKTKL